VESPIVVVGVDVRGSEDAIRQAGYVASWIAKFRADAYILYVTDSELVKKASLADDEYFTVHERKKFIIEGSIEKGREVVGKLKETFKKYRIRCFEHVEIGDPIHEIVKAAKETNAVGVIPFGIPVNKLIRKCSTPVVLVPKDENRGFADVIKEKIVMKLPFYSIIFR